MWDAHVDFRRLFRISILHHCCRCSKLAAQVSALLLPRGRSWRGLLMRAVFVPRLRAATWSSAQFLQKNLWDQSCCLKRDSSHELQLRSLMIQRRCEENFENGSLPDMGQGDRSAWKAFRVEFRKLFKKVFELQSGSRAACAHPQCQERARKRNSNIHSKRPHFVPQIH